MMTNTNKGAQTMSATKTLAARIASTYSVSLEPDTDSSAYVTADSLPIADAERFAQELRDAGFADVSVARDSEDRSIAWVYVTIAAPAPTYTITASDPTPTEFEVPGGIDVDVQIETEDTVICGQVTLAPDHSGRMGSWGDRDMWVSGSLCTWIDSRWPRGPEQRQILDEIEAAAVDAL